MPLRKTMVEGVYRDEYGSYIVIVKRQGDVPKRRSFWAFKSAAQEAAMLIRRGAKFDQMFGFFKL